jgi:hypothetical protein
MLTSSRIWLPWRLHHGLGRSVPAGGRQDLHEPFWPY